MSLEGKKIIVTGGSRGLGLGLVEALVDRSADVTVVARDVSALSALRSRLAVATISADVADEAVAQSALSDIRPDILVLNAGAKPKTSRIDQISWEDFSNTWNVDVKAGLAWVQAALNLPLDRGSRVLLTSSGAAIGGSPLSGGYGGAKRMLWLIAKYANGVSQQDDLGILFQTIVPQQMVAGTGVGETGARAYGDAAGIGGDEFLSRFPPMPPRAFGELVVSVLEDPEKANGLAFGLRGDTGVTVLEEVAA